MSSVQIVLVHGLIGVVGYGFRVITQGTPKIGKKGVLVIDCLSLWLVGPA